MRWRRSGQRRGATAAALAAIAALAGCGGVAENAIVVRVGDQAISKATVDRWAHVIERGGAFGGFRGDPQGTRKQRAIALLVTSNWLIGEAVRQGVPVSQAQVEQAVAARESEGPGFQRHLRATGQTRAGVELEVRAELAAEAIREKLAEQADDVTQRQVLAYYRQNRALFSAPEVRITDLLENQASARAAAALVSRIGTGVPFTRLAFHEHVERTPGFMRTPQKARLVEAIFAARPGAVSAPMPLNSGWAVFVVRKVLPARPEPFSKVQEQVLTRLRAQRQRGLKTQFDREYTTFWRSRTRCERGYVYVGPGCPQYNGTLGPYEDPFSLQAHPALSEQG